MVHYDATDDLAPSVARRRLWIVNQYAIPADQPGITRHAMLSDQLKHFGWATTIFASRTHYWNLDSKRSTSDVETRPEATFVRIATSGSVTNGVRRVISMINFSARIFLVASKRIHEERPDAVLGSSPHLFGAFAAQVLARRANVPFVLEVRDVWPESLVQLLGLSRRHPLVLAMTVIERYLYRRADLIVSVLPGLAPHIARVAGRVHAPLVHVPNGVIVEHVRLPDQDEVEDDVEEAFTVMYGGAHGVPNCLDDLLAAAAIIQQDEELKGPHQRTRFVLIGDGKEKASLVAQARNMGLLNVTFVEPMPKSELVERFKSADCFVLLWRDTPLYRLGVSPNKLFDYFAASKPVIMGLNAPFDPVREAGAGLSVPAQAPAAVAGAIQRLRSMSPSEREAMGRAGFTYLRQNHDVAHLAARYASALDAVVQRVPATEVAPPSASLPDHLLRRRWFRRGRK